MARLFENQISLGQIDPSFTEEIFRGNAFSFDGIARNKDREPIDIRAWRITANAEFYRGNYDSETQEFTDAVNAGFDSRALNMDLSNAENGEWRLDIP